MTDTPSKSTHYVTWLATDAATIDATFWDTHAATRDATYDDATRATYVATTRATGFVVEEGLKCQ